MRRSLVVLALLMAPEVAAAQAPVVDMGWLADGRRFTVGDIITVVVDEYTSASADRSTSALRDRTSEAGVSLGGTISNTEATLGSFMGNTSTERGRDLRQDRISSEVSVRVTEVEPNGALRIEGTKILVIDEHEQEVTVRGVIRPQDISSMNTVDSWRVAEAEVLYGTEGTLGQPEKSMIMKLLGWIIP